MSLILVGRPGSVTVINYPNYAGLGILQSSDFPSNQAIIVYRFSQRGNVRIALDYSLTNIPYLYVFGTSLTELAISFMLFPFLDCNSSGAILSFLTFLDQKLVSASTNPRINLTIGGKSWRGVIVGFSMESGIRDDMPETVHATITAVGNYL